jgi:hypothetical protein
MADDKQGREDQARAADRRRQERDIAEALERRDETEPPIPDAELAEVEEVLESVEFPAKAADIVEATDGAVIETPVGSYAVAELLPEDRYRSRAAVRARLQRPAISTALARIDAATAEVGGVELSDSRRETYEKTLRALASIDATDRDEGVEAVTDWILDRLAETGDLPSSRAVRREAARFCRSNGYSVSNNDWLGI